MKKMAFWMPTFIGWLIASLIAGVVGWVGALRYDLPGYVGGPASFVLVAMMGTFALAAKVAARARTSPEKPD